MFSLFDILNPFVLFVLYYIFFFFIALSWQENFAIEKGVTINSDTAKIISLSLLMILMSAIIFKYVFKYEKNIKPIQLRKIDLRSINFAPSKMNGDRAAILLFFIGIGLFLIFILMVGEIPLLAHDAENFRIESRKGNGLISILSIGLISYSSSYLFASTNIGKSKRLFILILSFFIILMFGNRGPAFLLLVYAVIISIVRSKMKISMIKLIIIGGIGYLLLVGIGAYRMNVEADFFTKFILTIGWRPFVNIQNFDIILSRFDDFLYGYGYWIDLYTLAPGYSPNLGTWLKENMGFSFDGGSVTITLLGEGYINFGTVGLIIYPVITSFILIRLGVYIKRILLKDNLTVYIGKFILILSINVALAGIVSSGFTSVILYIIIPNIIIYKLHQILAKTKNI